MILNQLEHFFASENELNLLGKLLFQNSPLEIAPFAPPTPINSTPGPNLYIVGIVIGLYTRH